MSLITRTSFALGDVLTTSEWNTQFDTAYNEINGSLNSDNLASGGVNDDRLARSYLDLSAGVSATAGGVYTYSGTLIAATVTGLTSLNVSGPITGITTLTTTDKITVGDAGISTVNSNVIDDDVAESFTPSNTGVLILWSNESSGINVNAVVAYRTTATLFTTSLAIGSDVEITTGVLSGTTGNDTKFTISVSGGLIYLENRIGSNLDIGYLVIAG